MLHLHNNTPKYRQVASVEVQNFEGMRFGGVRRHLPLWFGRRLGGLENSHPLIARGGRKAIGLSGVKQLCVKRAAIVDSAKVMHGRFPIAFSMTPLEYKVVLGLFDDGEFAGRTRASAFGFPRFIDLPGEEGNVGRNRRVDAQENLRRVLKRFSTGNVLAEVCGPRSGDACAEAAVGRG